MGGGVRGCRPSPARGVDCLCRLGTLWCVSNSSCSSGQRACTSSERGGPLVPPLLSSSRYMAQADVSIPCTADLVQGLAGGHEGASIGLLSSIGACHMHVHVHVRLH